MAFEVNFDGLVGPTHNYSGLSTGNLASTRNKAQVSSPLGAVLQGLEKMKRLSDLGLRQAVLPPQERPLVPALRQLGFSGTDEAVLEKAHSAAPELLSAVSSASSMWTANAATVSPSADTSDGKVHFTPANLVSKFHRSLEPPTTAAVLRAIFRDERRFSHHDPLPATAAFGDEGAANHTRFCAEYGGPGVEFFVYGRQALRAGQPEPRRFPARQTLEAASAIARLHGLDPARVVLAQQNPEAIDAGVFHNDVAGVGNRDVYFHHEESLVDRDGTLELLRARFRAACGGELREIRVPAASVSLPDAVKSYLFNGQLISPPSGGMALVLPHECETTPSVAAYLQELVSDTTQPIRTVLFMDLKQSMSNGGGPACLRLRVVLTDEEIRATNPRVFLTDALYGELTAWARKHYRDRLSPDDLRDPALLRESRAALDELTRILGLGAVYAFQR